MIKLLKRIRQKYCKHSWRSVYENGQHIETYCIKCGLRTIIINVGKIKVHCTKGGMSEIGTLLKQYGYEQYKYNQWREKAITGGKDE